METSTSGGCRGLRGSPPLLGKQRGIVPAIQTASNPGDLSFQDEESEEPVRLRRLGQVFLIKRERLTS